MTDLGPDDTHTAFREEAARLKLKRGGGMAFDGKNWKLAGDQQWQRHRMYVPYGGEPYMGRRNIGGREYAVFCCRDDGFFAQPVEVCELPVPDDPMLVLYEEKGEGGPGGAGAGRSLSVIPGALHFPGKNWRLASDSRWAKATRFSEPKVATRVGERKIRDADYDVYRDEAGSGFVAVRRD